MWSNLKVGSKVINVLQKIIQSNKVGTSIVLEGQEDITTEVALEFAKAINCVVKNEDPCDQCVSCITTMNGNNPDVIIVGIQEGKKGILVEQIRSLNLEAAKKPFREEFKVIIIKNAETMNTSSQNAFLKLLEEPPANVQFILLVKDIGKLLPTIKSRCISINTYRLTKEESNNIFDNSLSSYLSMAGARQDMVKLNDEVLDIIKEYPKKDVISVIKDGENLINSYANNLKDVLVIIELWIRDLLMACQNGEKYIINTKHQEQVKKASNQYSLAKLHSLIEDVMNTKSSLDVGCNQKLVLTALLLKLAY